MKPHDTTVPAERTMLAWRRLGLALLALTLLVARLLAETELLVAAFIGGVCLIGGVWMLTLVQRQLALLHADINRPRSPATFLVLAAAGLVVLALSAVFLALTQT